MPIVDVEQNSVDWLKMRQGCVTASNVWRVMKKLKRSPNTESDIRANYRKEVARERHIGRSGNHFVSHWMQEGKDWEPLARREYQRATGNRVDGGGLALHPNIRWFAASADGLIGDDGCLEIKCLKDNNHFDVILDAVIPDEYKWQMYAQMSCAEREWCDFVAFHNDFRPQTRLFVRRLRRDDKLIAEMEAEVEKFLAEVDLVMKRLEACSPLEDDLTGILTASVAQLEAKQ